MSERQRIFPAIPAGARAFGDEPVLLDGMKVVFDQKVALYPVTLEEPVAPTAQRRRAQRLAESPRRVHGHPARRRSDA